MEEKFLEKLWICPCLLCTGEILQDEFDGEKSNKSALAAAGEISR